MTVHAAEAADAANTDQRKDTGMAGTGTGVMERPERTKDMAVEAGQGLAPMRGGKGRSIPMRVQQGAESAIVERMTHLYAHPAMSMTRELISNAQDAVIAAGGGGRRVTVECPKDEESPLLTVKDQGTGMDERTIIDVYSRYGATTKARDLHQIGSYGIGAKAPLAYADGFQGKSVKDGVCTTFVVERTGQGNRLDITGSGLRTGEDDGTVITVPVRKDGMQDVISAAEAYLHAPVPCIIEVDGVVRRPGDPCPEYTHAADVAYMGGTVGVWVNKTRRWTEGEPSGRILRRIFVDGNTDTVEVSLGGWPYGYGLNGRSWANEINQDGGWPAAGDECLLSVEPGMLDFDSARDSILPNDKFDTLCKAVREALVSGRDALHDAGLTSRDWMALRGRIEPTEREAPNGKRLSRLRALGPDPSKPECGPKLALTLGDPPVEGVAVGLKMRYSTSTGMYRLDSAEHIVPEPADDDGRAAVLMGAVEDTNGRFSTKAVDRLVDGGLGRKDGAPSLDAVAFYAGRTGSLLIVAAGCGKGARKRVLGWLAGRTDADNPVKDCTILFTGDPADAKLAGRVKRLNGAMGRVVLYDDGKDGGQAKTAQAGRKRSSLESYDLKPGRDGGVRGGLLDMAYAAFKEHELRTVVKDGDLNTDTPLDGDMPMIVCGNRKATAPVLALLSMEWPADRPVRIVDVARTGRTAFDGEVCERLSERGRADRILFIDRRSADGKDKGLPNTLIRRMKNHDRIDKAVLKDGRDIPHIIRCDGMPDPWWHDDKWSEVRTLHDNPGPVFGQLDRIMYDFAVTGGARSSLSFIGGLRKGGATGFDEEVPPVCDLPDWMRNLSRDAVLAMNGRTTEDLDAVGSAYSKSHAMDALLKRAMAAAGWRASSRSLAAMVRLALQDGVPVGQEVIDLAAVVAMGVEMEEQHRSDDMILLSRIVGMLPGNGAHDPDRPLGRLGEPLVKAIRAEVARQRRRITGRLGARHARQRHESMRRQGAPLEPLDAWMEASAR